MLQFLIKIFLNFKDPEKKIIIIMFIFGSYKNVVSLNLVFNSKLNIIFVSVEITF